MKLIPTLGLATAIVSVASWLDARHPRRLDARRERERIDQTRWEGEGGATSAGPQLSEHEPPMDHPTPHRSSSGPH